MLYRLAYRKYDEDIFLHFGYLFSEEHSLYQVDKNLINTLVSFRDSKATIFLET